MTSPTRLALASASDALARIETPSPTVGEGRVGNIAPLQPVPHNDPLPTLPRKRGREKQRKPRNPSPRKRGEVRESLEARAAGADVAAYAAAVALAGVAAFFSIRGMAVLFPGATVSVVVMAAAMEGAPSSSPPAGSAAAGAPPRGCGGWR